jgi:hypothetical protein
MEVVNCSIPYITTPVPALPIYDGSHNPIGAAIGSAGADYAKGVAHLNYGRGNRTGLRGTTLTSSFPDFNGNNPINVNDQMWNDNLDPLCSVVRNDSGVCIITVPATAVAAAGAGHIALGNMPGGYCFTEMILDVTTGFSGAAVTGIKASLGQDVGAADDFLLAASISSPGQIGVASADRGTLWDAGRFIVPFTYGGVSSPIGILKITVTGGSIADINVGSLNVYLQFQRLKVPTS